VDEVQSGVGGFEQFFAIAEPALRRALVAGFGAEAGRDATAEALTYGWREWGRVSAMDNPTGYLYRVGERWAKRQRPLRPLPMSESAQPEADPGEPGLEKALETLTLRQRQAVVIVWGFGLSHAETAELLGVSRSSIQNHVERGMAKLRQNLGAVL